MSDVDDQHVLGCVSGILTLGAEETLRKKHGAYEQNHRTADLRRDQEILKAGPASA
jgi:hypothetical protein